MRKRWKGVVALIGLTAMTAAASTSPAGAASLSVAPTRIELAPDQRSAHLTLQNDADVAVTVQVQTFAWRGPAATESLEATRDLLAVPPVFALPPKAKQIIRVALRRPFAGEDEQAYRLMITEVPEPRDRGQMGVVFALRLSLPVFVTPPGAVPEPSWSLDAAGPQGPMLRVANRGRAHIQVRRLELRPVAAPGGEPVQVIDTPAYILPGQSHAWPLAAAAGGGRTALRLQAETDIGPLAADLAPSPR